MENMTFCVPRMRAEKNVIHEISNEKLNFEQGMTQLLSQDASPCVSGGFKGNPQFLESPLRNDFGGWFGWWKIRLANCKDLSHLEPTTVVFLHPFFFFSPCELGPECTHLTRRRCSSIPSTCASRRRPGFFGARRARGATSFCVGRYCPLALGFARLHKAFYSGDFCCDCSIVG